MKKNELIRAVNFSDRQEELYPLLERQVKIYTMGDSSSVPAETARELLRSITFCIETHMIHSSEDAKGDPLAWLFEKGQRDVWKLTEDAKALHQLAKQTDPGYGSIAYRDTLGEVETFFRVYDLRFFAHNIPCMIDYPLGQPMPEVLEGIRYIGEYLRRLILENRFCGCFARRDAIRLLRVYSPEYRELVLNLFEPVFTCAIGLTLLKRNPSDLQVDTGDCKRLYQMFRPWDEKQAETWLREAVNRLCVRFRLWDTGMRDYLIGAAENLLPMSHHTSHEGYRNLFCAPQ